MTQKTVTSREFNLDIAAAKRAAKEGPVVVTDRGEPAFVLISWGDYRRLADKEGRSLADLLHQEDEGDFAFDPPKLNLGLRPADLS